MADSKVRMKVGVHEFEAAGAPEVVAAQLEAWKALIGSGAAASPSVAEPAAAQPPIKTDGSGVKFDNTVLGRAFLADQTKGIVKLQLPIDGEHSESTALLLILYGFHKMLGEEWTKVTRVKPSMDSSGHTPRRIAEAAERLRKTNLILMRGNAKGSQYQITMRGIQEAERLVSDLAGQLPPRVPLNGGAA